VADVKNFDSLLVLDNFVEDSVRAVAGFTRPAGSVPLVGGPKMGMAAEEFALSEQAVADAVGRVRIILGDVPPDCLGVRQGGLGYDDCKVHCAAFCFASSSE
jgi:hypothetical protein